MRPSLGILSLYAPEGPKGIPGAVAKSGHRSPTKEKEEIVTRSAMSRWRAFSFRCVDGAVLGEYLKRVA